MKLFDPTTRKFSNVTEDPLTLSARTGHLLLTMWRAASLLAYPKPQPLPLDWKGVSLLGTLANLDDPNIRAAFPDVTEVYDRTHWQTCWALYGCPTFQLTHGLTSALLLTDCRGLRIEDVSWPFESFAIVLPNPGSPFKFLPLNATAPVEGRWIRVHRYAVPRTSEERAALEQRVNDMHQRAARMKDASGEYIRGLLEMPNPPMCSRTVVSVDDADGGSVYQADRWPSEGSVEEWLECRQHRAPETTTSFTDMDQFAVQAASRLVLNLCVYINTQHRERGQDFAIKTPKQTREGHYRPYVWQVGSEIKLPKEMRDAAAAFAQKHKDKATWRVHSRFVVRGHYQRYWTGPKKSPQRECRVKWVAPYWKGPENGPRITSRLYAVDTPT